MEYIIAFLVLLIMVGLMACGVIFSGKRIRGSCGGLSPDGNKNCVCKIKDSDFCGQKTSAEIREIIDLK